MVDEISLIGCSCCGDSVGSGYAESGGTGDTNSTAETGDDSSDDTIVHNGEAESDSAASDDAEADETDSGGTTDVDGELEIHHTDVGQADATLLIEPSGETSLIDSDD